MNIAKLENYAPFENEYFDILFQKYADKFFQNLHARFEESENTKIYSNPKELVEAPNYLWRQTLTHDLVFHLSLLSSFLATPKHMGARSNNKDKADSLAVELDNAIKSLKKIRDIKKIDLNDFKNHEYYYSLVDYQRKSTGMNKGIPFEENILFPKLEQFNIFLENLNHHIEDQCNDLRKIICQVENINNFTGFAFSYEFLKRELLTLSPPLVLLEFLKGVVDGLVPLFKDKSFDITLKSLNKISELHFDSCDFEYCDSNSCECQILNINTDTSIKNCIKPPKCKNCGTTLELIECEYGEPELEQPPPFCLRYFDYDKRKIKIE